jgi:diguanylate cyclase (GGDEF)-like protein
MFAAIDAKDQATAVRIDNEQTEPTFARIDELVRAATDEHAGKAARAVADLRRDEERIFLFMTVGFAVGLCMLGALGAVVTGHQRAMLRQAEASRRQALHDPLTGLPNRALFADRLTQSLRSAHRTGTSVAVVLMDLDRFKEVNDTLGHHCGDELLRQIAVRIGEVLRAGDTVARLSGDEFAVLLPGADEARAAVSAERILTTVHRSFVLDDVTIDVEVSVGIAAAPAHADSTEALLRCADLAMDTAKSSKTGSVTYQPAMDVQDPGRLLLLGELRRALDATDQLVVHYQPKVSLSSGELCGVEALVRWQHPTRSRLVLPTDFIPMAETTGLINSLTRYVLRIAVRQARDWLDQGLRIPVAVNLSPRCLLDTSLSAHVTALLDEYAVPAALLRLEVTETAVMANPALALTILTGLHDLGIPLSIDDYGTGYSSMAYLRRLPVDELKVDRSFVADMSGNGAVLVRSAIDLGHNLGLTVVAEGVETAAHVTTLRSLGCDVAQGYHYARPMTAHDFTLWLGERRVPSFRGEICDGY